MKEAFHRWKQSRMILERTTKRFQGNVPRVLALGGLASTNPIARPKAPALYAMGKRYRASAIKDFSSWYGGDNTVNIYFLSFTRKGFERFKGMEKYVYIERDGNIMLDARLGKHLRMEK